MHPILQEAVSSWATGLSLTVAFLLILRPTPLRLRIARVLWWVAGLARTGYLGFRLFFAFALAAAFSSGLSLGIGFLLPCLWFAVLVAEGLLLRPSVPQATALRYGRILILLVDPLLHAVPAWGSSFPRFPLGFDWLASAVLWFWIRERLDACAKAPQPSSSDLCGPAIPATDRCGETD